ncbi:MAG TPA: hypothetical protein VGB54_11110 [Allosphingosinicella sp.]|jgi:gp16 family phage-associated protein
MPAESLFAPISKDAIRRARARLALAGQSVEDWSVANGYNAKTVYGVLSGARPAIRGKALKIAIALGLRQHPDAPGHQGPAASIDRNLAAGLPASDRNRSSGLQLGEPAR